MNKPIGGGYDDCWHFRVPEDAKRFRLATSALRSLRWTWTVDVVVADIHPAFAHGNAQLHFVPKRVQKKTVFK